MGDFFSEIGVQVRRLWRGLATWQRGILVSVLVLVPLGIVWLVVALRPSYVVLYGNLSETDRLAMERRLDDVQIGYRTDSADGAMLVDPRDKDRARILLAQDGLPHVRTEGYTLFDRQRLGATEFEQRLNYKRALEQELQEAVQQLGGILQARVLLNIPRPTVFTERENLPTASVILILNDSGLSDKEVQGISRLVSFAVEGLVPENVAVSDATGRIISKRHDALAAITDVQQTFREMEERTYEDKILNQLMTAYGNKVDGQAITAVASPKCTARFDHDTLETETTTYDPESVTAKEHIVSENSEGAPVSPVGVPGVTSNILGVGAVGGSGTYTREESTTEYQSGFTRQLRVQAPKLTALSTAVLVNSEVLPAAAEARIEEMAKITRLIGAAVGFDTAATTTVVQAPQVEFLSFAPAPLVVPVEAIITWWQNPLIIIIMVLGLLAVALAALLLKPRYAPEEETSAEFLSDEDQGELRDLLERQRGALEEAEMERLGRRRQALIDLADANPEEIERVMRHWGEIHE